MDKTNHLDYESAKPPAQQPRKREKRPPLIYSPKMNIPLGKPVLLPNGGHGICVKWKRGKKEVRETVSLDKLHELVAQGISADPDQRTP